MGMFELEKKKSSITNEYKDAEIKDLCDGDKGNDGSNEGKDDADNA